MATIREFEIKANTDEATKSVEELKHQLEESQEKAKELEEALADANKEAARGSKDAANADREAARAKEDVIRTIDRATGGYVELGKKSLKTFSVILNESKKAIASAKQWYAALSPNNAFKKVIESVKNLGTALKASFKGGVAGANSLKTAIAATGIGLLVTGVAAVAAYWDDIVGSTNDEVSAIDLAVESATAMRQEQEAILNILLNSDNILREQGKSEKEILELKKAQTAETIKAYEAEVAVLKVKAEQEEKEREAVRGYLKAKGFSDVDVERLIKESLKESNAAKQLAETEAALVALKNTAAGYRLSEQEADEYDYNKKQSDLEKHNQTLKKLQDDALNTRMSRLEAEEKDDLVRENLRFANEGKRLTAQRADEIKEAKGNRELISAINAKYDELALSAQQTHNDNVKKINDKRAEDEKKALDDAAKAREQAEKEALENYRKIQDLELQLKEDGAVKELEALDLKYARLMEAEMGNQEALLLLQDLYEKEKAATQKKYDDEAIAKRKANQKQIADIVLESANSTIKNLMDLNQLYDENDKEAAKRAFERNKSLQIVQAIINTAGGIMGELNNPTGVITGTNWAKAALIATTGATQIATISAQQFNEGKAAGGAAPKAPATPQIAPSFNIVGQSNTNQLLQGIAGQFANPLRAYVVGGDITSSQEMERKRIKTATFG